MENEHTKELAYLFDRDEQEVETLMEEAEEAAVEVTDDEETIVPVEKKILTKEEKKIEKQKQKKRKKEHFPKKTTMNLSYKIDKTTRPATILFYVACAAVVLLVVVKFGVLDMVQKVTNLEQELVTMEDNVQLMTDALKDYSKVQGMYNRYTQGYLQDNEKPIDRLTILDMLEETVFAKSDLESASIVENSIFIEYTGLDLEETSALVKELESYKWVKDVFVQNANLTVNETTGIETIATTMIIETYATPEEVPADE